MRRALSEFPAAFSRPTAPGRARGSTVGITAALALLVLPHAITPSAGAAAAGLGDLDGRFGFILNGAASPDQAGFVVRGAGDVNGDGRDDLIIAAYSAGPNGFASGAAYVVFGVQGERPSPLALGTLSGADGFAINGAADGDFASGAAGAGDVNGDGIDDVIIGAFAADPNGASSGASYVVFGSLAPFPAAVELSALDGTNGFALNGVGTPDRSGVSVAGAGDVNGDGFGDVLIGALNASPNGTGSGEAYVVFGHGGVFPAAFELATLDGTNGFVINGAAGGDQTGTSVAGAGDVNADGFDDVIIGASKADPNGFESGAAYVVFGKDTGYTAAIEAGDLDGTDGFAIHGAAGGDFTAASVAAAGDVNDDGIDDVIIGASQNDATAPEAGAAYVVYGSGTGFGAVIDLGTLAPAGATIRGGAADDFAGTSVAAAGDFNGDGVDDLLVGARGANLTSGAAYVVYGVAGGLPAATDLAALDGTNGFTLTGAFFGDEAGHSVGGGFDLDDDGRPDVAVGAPGADPAGSFSGASYVVYGSDADCNDNGLIDFLDVASGAEPDDDGDGIPDTCVCPGDFDGSGHVAFADLLDLLAAWGPCPGCPQDLTDDDAVAFDDLLALLAAWGDC